MNHRGIEGAFGVDAQDGETSAGAFGAHTLVFEARFEGPVGEHAAGPARSHTALNNQGGGAGVDGVSGAHLDGLIGQKLLIADPHAVRAAQVFEQDLRPDVQHHVASRNQRVIDADVGPFGAPDQHVSAVRQRMHRIHALAGHEQPQMPTLGAVGTNNLGVFGLVVVEQGSSRAGG